MVSPGIVFGTKRNPGEQAIYPTPLIVECFAGEYFHKLVERTIRNAYRFGDNLEQTRNRNCVLYNVSNISDAMQVVRKQKPELILVDAILTAVPGESPELNLTSEFIKPIREEEYSGRIICWGFHKQGDDLSALAAGADLFIPEDSLTDTESNLDFRAAMRHVLERHPFAYDPAMRADWRK